jgi:hypothetical protein
MHFVDAMHGLAFYSTRDTVAMQAGQDLYGTADGGRHWVLESGNGYIPTPTGEHARRPQFGWRLQEDFSMLDASSAVFSDSEFGASPMGFFTCATADLGATATCRVVPGLPDLVAIASITAAAGNWWVAVVEAADESGATIAVLSSADRGRTWRRRMSAVVSP